MELTASKQSLPIFDMMKRARLILTQYGMTNTVPAGRQGEQHMTPLQNIILVI